MPQGTRALRTIAIAVLVMGCLVPPSAASITRTSGPAQLFTEPLLYVKFDVAFDEAHNVYLVVWGTQGSGPTKGLFLNGAGNAISQAFAISSGSEQAGWARVAYSPTDQKFLVSYTKILGNGRHQRAARLVMWSGAPVLPAPETILDDWVGQSGSESGLTYSATAGKFFVTWWTWPGTYPQSYVGIVDPSTGASTGAKITLTSPGDGQSDPEIACDPASHRCLVVGYSWGVYANNLNSTWARVIDDSTAQPIGDFFYADSWGIEGDPVVTSNGAGNFVVSYVRDFKSVWNTIVTPAGQRSSPKLVRASTNAAEDGGGYGTINVTYNRGSQSLLYSMSDWYGYTDVQEVGQDGAPLSGGFDRLPTPESNVELRTRYSMPTSNASAREFLIVDNQRFLIGRTALYATAGGQSFDRADFNGDSFGDLLWQNDATGGLSVWFMNGTQLIDGTWLSPNQVDDTNWKVVGAYDMNRDGYTDLIWQHATGWVAVWLMRGTSRISAELLYPTPIDPAWRIVGSGDLDGDGYGDLIWQHQDGTVAVWYMRGTSMISAEAIGGVSDPGWRVYGAADMNRDGKLDFVWRHSSTGQVSVWLMDNRRLIDGVAVGIEPDPDWKIVGLSDFNHDGKTDIAWWNQRSGNVAAWLMNGATLLNGVFLSPSGVGDVSWRVVGPR